MTRSPRLLGRLLLLSGLFLLPGAAGAQELYTYTVGILGGIGGSFDAEPGDSLTNTGLQLNLGLVTDTRTHLVARVGQLALDEDERFGSLFDADLTYATIGGEYRANERFYESGIYVALGGYRLEGTDRFGDDSSDTSIGAALGVTGEFPINRWLGFQVELSGHYVDFHEAQIFAMGHAGLAFHF